MKIEELIGKDKYYVPPFRIVGNYIEDSNGDTVVDVDDLCLGIVGYCMPIAEHIVELLNQRWDDTGQYMTWNRYPETRPEQSGEYLTVYQPDKESFPAVDILDWDPDRQEFGANFGDGWVSADYGIKVWMMKPTLPKTI